MGAGNLKDKTVKKIACRDCQFFVKMPSGGPKVGQCRFSPPTPMILGMRQVPGLTGIPGANGGVEPVIGSQFPPVAEDTWCGCFRPAHIEQDTHQ